MYPLLAGIVLLGAMAGLRLGVGRFVVLIALALPCLGIAMIVAGQTLADTILWLFASAFAVQLGYFLALVGRALTAGEPEPVVERDDATEPMTDATITLSPFLAPARSGRDPRG